MVLFIGGLGVPVDVSAAVVLLLFFLLLLLLLLLFCRKRKLLAFWKPMSRYVHVCDTLLVICDLCTQELVASGYHTLVALYTARLPAPLQVSCYASLLEGGGGRNTEV